MGVMSTMLPLMISGYTNGVAVPKTESTGNGQQTGSGLFNYTTNETKPEGSYNTKDNRIFFAQSQPIQNIPIITITGSTVSDTGNTGYANPTSFTPTTTQSDSGKYDDKESSGIDLTSIIVPVAGIAGVAALAYLLLGNDDVKQAVEKKVGGKKKNE